MFKQMFRWLKVFGVVGGMLFWQCDGERWWGYHFDALPLTEQIIIQGTVTNQFTETPIGGATVRFDEQETITNAAGQYSLRFLITSDFQRNKPLTIRVEADDYLPFQQKVFIEPIDQQRDFSLMYAAPILQAAVRHVFEDGIAVVQVKILDYQDDIQTVRLTVNYRAGNKSLLLQFSMSWIGREDNQIRIYQAKVVTRISQNFTIYTIGPEFSILAVDSLGYDGQKTYFQPLDDNPPLFIPYHPDSPTRSTNGF